MVTILPRAQAPPSRAVTARRPLRIAPAFFSFQLECDTCGNELEDALILEELGRYCSQRCFHARDLPLLLRRGA